jgi:hypothetical protein
MRLNLLSWSSGYAYSVRFTYAAIGRSDGFDIASYNRTPNCRILYQRSDLIRCIPSPIHPEDRNTNIHNRGLTSSIYIIKRTHIFPNLREDCTYRYDPRLRSSRDGGDRREGLWLAFLLHHSITEQRPARGTIAVFLTCQGNI